MPRIPCLLSLWAAAAVLIGTVFTSFHQPFQSPNPGILTLAKAMDRPGWLALHILSSNCGCSERVMRHLLARRPFTGAVEQVLVIDDDGPQLPAVSSLLAELGQEGFSVFRIKAKDLPQAVGLRGVPLLVIASPERKISYMGGYGSASDQDGTIFQQVSLGMRPEPLAVLGCAIARGLRQKVDPWHMKY